jgi:hypothetical protein
MIPMCHIGVASQSRWNVEVDHAVRGSLRDSYE